jgi:hypothetical protein
MGSRSAFFIQRRKTVMLFKSKTPGPGSTNGAREALLREETLFLLQGHGACFSRQLRARLLEEGCNLPLAVARPLFYRHIVLRLSAALEASGQAAYTRRFPENGDRLIHPQFHRIIRFLHARLPNAEECMARAVLDAAAAVLAFWRLDETMFTQKPEIFETFARQMAARIVDGSHAGGLAGLPFDVVIRRLRLALTVSLLRHVKDPEGFRSEFGLIPQVLKAIPGDPVVFSRVMSFLLGQVPYFSHVASQVFWRTLNNLDAERGAGLEAT